jgi:NAD(P)-dependent dehydrogenase (short-subunit alcohol dehydrogenase family)
MPVLRLTVQSQVDDWDKIMRVNGRGGRSRHRHLKDHYLSLSVTVFLGIKYSAMAMKSGSSIAVTSSQLGLEGAPGNAACESIASFRSEE